MKCLWPQLWARTPGGAELAAVFVSLPAADGITKACFPARVEKEKNSSLVAHVPSVCLAGFGDGKYVSFEERQWHKPCFKCSRCSVSLVGSGFFPDRDQILCTDCNNEDWPAEKLLTLSFARPVSPMTQSSVFTTQRCRNLVYYFCFFNVLVLHIKELIKT